MTPARIRRLRKRHNLTQQALADYLGVDQSTVSRWEGEGVMPSGPALRLLGQMEGAILAAPEFPPSRTRTRGRQRAEAA